MSLFVHRHRAIFFRSHSVLFAWRDYASQDISCLRHMARSPFDVYLYHKHAFANLYGVMPAEKTYPFTHGYLSIYMGSHSYLLLLRTFIHAFRHKVIRISQFSTHFWNRVVVFVFSSHLSDDRPCWFIRSPHDTTDHDSFVKQWFRVRRTLFPLSIRWKQHVIDRRIDCSDMETNLEQFVRRIRIGADESNNISSFSISVFSLTRQYQSLRSLTIIVKCETPDRSSEIDAGPF